ncbi:hypothetical protein GCM10007028_28090 [Algibacter mikhailovii]|uniref:Uncharacterized protein n=1 Tax=Algibacter mikhailovii TaxID=425498 RepID=A0A918VCH7_9FLAO|nr:hypothetical protein GCM10007028_28090 [Algibacter mikhailovii]
MNNKSIITKVKEKSSHLFYLNKLKTEVQFLNRNLTQLKENIVNTQKELHTHLKDIDFLKNN